jgi:aarF domain-containing kinase
LLGVPAVLLTSKVLWALAPLLGAKPLTDAELVAKLLERSRSERSVVGWAWLISEASDRLIRDVYTAATIVSDYWRNGKGLDDWSPLHQRAADRLLKLCETNKGIYIKLGQHVAQLAYLLPKEYVSTMSVLTHAAPRDSWQQASAVFREEFGREITDVFASVDPEPIASASLAQVHVGTLKTGERVAIKIQHAGLRETSDADIKTLSALLHLVKALFPKFDYLWLAEETEENLPKELDFRVEARNAQLTSTAFAHRPDVVCPTVYPALSSQRVLVMSFEEGVYVNNRPALERMGLAPADVARLVSEAFAEQIFLMGRVHSDPHAANLLIRPMPGRPGKPQLVLLDHGLYRDISRIRMSYAHMWRALVFGDERGIKRYSAEMGAGDMYQLFASMLTTRSWDKILGADDETRLEDLRVTPDADIKAETAAYAKQYSNEINVILARIPRELLLVLKTNDCLRNVDLALGCPVNNLVITARYTQRAINRDRRETRGGLLTALENAYDTLALEARVSTLSWVSHLYMWWTGGGSNAKRPEGAGVAVEQQAAALVPVAAVA